MANLKNFVMEEADRQFSSQEVNLEVQGLDDLFHYLLF